MMHANMRKKFNPVWNFVRSKTIGQQFRTFQPEESEDSIITSLAFVEQLMPEKTLVVCERSQNPKIHYVSANCERVFGYTAKEFAMMSIEDFLQRVHEDDIASVLQCYSYVNACEPYDPAQHRFETFYRFKAKDSTYNYIADEKLAIKTENEKYVYIAAFRNVNDAKIQRVYLNVHQMIGGTFRKIADYNPRYRNEAMTPRQQEITQLVSKGLSNKDIAEQLHISVNTIRNHKHSIFKKVNVKTSAALMVMGAK
jgi:DNA-binding CsgD family transcriptional regulator